MGQWPVAYSERRCVLFPRQRPDRRPAESSDLFALGDGLLFGADQCLQDPVCLICPAQPLRVQSRCGCVAEVRPVMFREPSKKWIPRSAVESLCRLPSLATFITGPWPPQNWFGCEGLCFRPTTNFGCLRAASGFFFFVGGSFI